MERATLESGMRLVRAAPGEQPHVDVLDEPLCSQSELRQAVIASAITSGIVCTIVGVGIGYVLGMREGR